MKKIFTILLLLHFYFICTVSLHAQGQDSLYAAEDNTQEQETLSISDRIDKNFAVFVDKLGQVLFYDPFAALNMYDPVIRDEAGNPVRDKKNIVVERNIPFIVLWLVFGALFFTVFMKFINFRRMGHAIALIRGKYDDPKHKGEVSHFQALATALSATVGLGNIGGVAIAIAIGGPGATLWMIIAGLLGMSTKFAECTLGVKYRRIDKNGNVSGGPMYYLREGLKKKRLGLLGKILAGLFALLVIGGSFGGGNMFQGNQAFEQISSVFPTVSNMGFWFGILLAVFVGVVIIGGIKSIARVTEKIVPFMAVFYVVVALIVIGIHYDHLGEAFREIYYGAFHAPAIKGGVIGVLIMGFRRAAFSNEAGIGSAPIAHSAVKTNEPVTEGIVALLEPFIDTVIICTMTALVIIISGSYTDYAGSTSTTAGVMLTSQAFGKVISWFPYMLTLAVLLFAFSTMISWSYYGIKGFDYLFGGYSEKLFGTRKVSDTVYRFIFLIFVIIGTSSGLNSVIDFSDMMILSMAIPNILGLFILAPEVKKDLKTYFKKIKTGEIKKYK